MIADDGVDTAEFTLIDDKGCPTEISIMSGVKKIKGFSKSLEAPFEAFKFPTSGVVQFRALVVPCLPTCEPVYCMGTSSFDGTRQRITSLGRKRRSSGLLSSSYKNESIDNELIVIQAIEIVDKFPDKKSNRKAISLDLLDSAINKRRTTSAKLSNGKPFLSDSSKNAFNLIDDDNSASSCMNINNLVVLCSLFLILQFIIISTWGYIKYKHSQLIVPRQFLQKDKNLSPQHQHHGSLQSSIASSRLKLASERANDRSFLSLDDINGFA